MRLLLSPDQVQQLTDELAEQAPERLFHVVGRRTGRTTYIVTGLALDDDAETSYSHCKSSSSGQNAVQALERATGGQYLGVIHSHPADSPEPSRQDARAAWDLLDLNPTLEAAMVGVVTATPHVDGAGQRLRLGRGLLSLHVAERGGDRTTLLPMAVEAITEEDAFLRSLHERVPAAALAALCSRSVTIFGAGSVGSIIAEQLARAGVGSLHLIDPDRVEPVNLSRSVFTTADLGRPKVEALADRVRVVNPLIEVTTSTSRLDDETITPLSGAVANADLVIAATDDPRAQGMIDHLLHRHDVSGLFAGVLPGAQLGEMVLVLPGVTTCYRCAVGQHREAASTPTTMDYATGRKTGLSALGADIAILATAAARTALSLLELQHGTDSSLLPAVVSGRTVVHLGLSPAAFAEYGAFDTTPAQHRFQSLWMAPDPGEECTACQAVPLPPATDPPDAQAAEAGPATDAPMAVDAADNGSVEVGA